MKPCQQVVAFWGTTGNISLIENGTPDNIFSSVLGPLANFQKLQMKAWQQFFVTTGTVGTGLGGGQRHKPKKRAGPASSRIGHDGVLADAFVRR